MFKIVHALSEDGEHPFSFLFHLPTGVENPLAVGCELCSATMPTAAGPAVQRWRSRYPGHPANDVVRTDIEMTGLTAQVERAPHIALLLPVSGKSAKPPMPTTRATKITISSWLFIFPTINFK